MTTASERMDAQAAAFRRIEVERDRQDDEFGVQVHDPAYWFAILGKQMGQLGEAVVRLKWASEPDAAKGILMHETTQVAAVAVALMEAIGLDELPNEITTAVPKDPRQRAKSLGLGHEAIQYDDEGTPEGAGTAYPVPPTQSVGPVSVLDLELPTEGEAVMHNDGC